MIDKRVARRLFAIAMCVALTATGCGFQGLNALPLPGARGHGSDAKVYHVLMPNVATLESNSPVMIDDVIVGSIGSITVENWHAVVEFSVEPDVVVPANAVAIIGQTSLLGSMHLELGVPLGQAPTGSLKPGTTIPLDRASTYPSTEQTLSSLAVVVNQGGLGQIGDIIHNFGAALSGREGDVRELLTRLDRFVGTLNGQRENLVALIGELNRLSATFAGRRDVITEALRTIPPALDVLVKEEPSLTTALDKLRVFADLTTGLINDTQADLVKNLQNLEPTLRALADVGPDLDTALAYFTTFPLGQDLIDRGLRGDYLNLYAVLDLTHNRLKRSLFLGTPWADEDAKLVPAPGDPGYDAFPLEYYYTKDPLRAAGIPIEPPGTPALAPGSVPAPSVGPPPVDDPPAGDGGR
jgi:virulence factor Mce-like protein